MKLMIKERINQLKARLLGDKDRLEKDLEAVSPANMEANPGDEEEQADEVYLSRVANGGRNAVLTKRFDRLDNIKALANAPAEFRAMKLAEIRSALPIWYRIDPDGACEIEKEVTP